MQEKVKDLLGMKNIPQRKYQKKIEKIPWDHTFLLEALSWSKRSHDAQTQHGCVIVKDKRILSTGYNGFIRDIDDTMLPNLRPYKYDFFIHAEQNAILNCTKHGVSTDGSTVYVTAHPCVTCFQMLWQAGIARIVYSNFVDSYMYTKEMSNKIDALLLLINGHGYVHFCNRKLALDFIDKKEIL